MDIEDISSNNNFESNESNEELFHSYIDRSIETGDVKFIQFAIKEFKNKIHISYINFANTILMQLIEEHIQDMEL
jgi:hypothetical protein